MNAKAIAARIAQNVKDVDSGRITWSEFSIRNRAAWDEAIRGELCVIGSACSKRVRAVHVALKVVA